MRALNEGHVFLPKRILCRNAAHILGVTPEDIEEHLLEMMIDRKIVIEEDESSLLHIPLPLSYALLLFPLVLPNGYPILHVQNTGSFH